MTKQDSQLEFSFLLPRKKVTVCVNAGEVTSDAGLLALKEFDHKIGYMDRVNEMIHDPRCQVMITHEQQGLLSQRVYGIIAGYEDCNDHQLLRHDPTFKAIAGSKDLQSPLGSQPTLCRLENRITSIDLCKLNDFLIETYLKSQPPRSIILDLDTTHDPCHGAQQLCLFNAHYKNFVYLPFVIFEGNTGHQLAARLRTGQKPSGEEIVGYLEPLVNRLKAEKKRATIELRADAEFASADLYEYLEAENIYYAIGITGWNPLKERAAPLLAKATRAYEKTKRPQKLFGSMYHRASTWNRRRRVVFKVEVSAQGTNQRFVITNKADPPDQVFKFYEGRGQCENHIKQLKNGLSADRLSCTDFVANYFRFLLHVIAYNLYVQFRRVLQQTLLADAQIDTMRLKLFKAGAQVQFTTRRICFRLSSSWPFAHIFHAACDAVAIFEPT